MKKIYILLFLFLVGCVSYHKTNKNVYSGNLEINKNYMTSKEEIVNKTVSTQEFKKLIETGKYIVIDLRTKEELDYFGIIPGMDLNYDVYNSGDLQKIYSLDKNKKYLIYCYHGTRSGQLKNILKQKGFKYVVDLQGGTDARTRNGEKLVTK